MERGGNSNFGSILHKLLQVEGHSILSGLELSAEFYYSIPFLFMFHDLYVDLF